MGNFFILVSRSFPSTPAVFLPLFSLTLFTANILAFKDFTSRDWSFFTILILPASLAFTIRFCNIFTDCSATSKSTANQFMWVISFLQDSITLYLSILKNFITINVIDISTNKKYAIFQYEAKFEPLCHTLHITIRFFLSPIPTKLSLLIAEKFVIIKVKINLS